MLCHVQCALRDVVCAFAKLQRFRDSEEKLLHLQALYLLPDIHCWLLYPWSSLSDSHDSR